MNTNNEKAEWIVQVDAEQYDGLILKAYKLGLPIKSARSKNRWLVIEGEKADLEAKFASLNAQVHAHVETSEPGTFEPSQTLPEDESMLIDITEESESFRAVSSEDILNTLGLKKQASVVEEKEIIVPDAAELAAYAANRAAAKERAVLDDKKVKAKKVVKSVRKIASFGGVTQTAETEDREITTPKTEDASKEAVKARLDSQLDSFDELVKLANGDVALANKLASDADELKKVKALRDELSGLFSVGVPKNHLSEMDNYISGVDTGEGGGVRNPDAGTDGVRISFKGSKSK